MSFHKHENGINYFKINNPAQLHHLTLLILMDFPKNADRKSIELYFENLGVMDRFDFNSGEFL